LKIGILTYHCGLNHGGYLQVFCLKKYLEELGHNVFVLNYVNEKQKKAEWNYFISSWPLTRPWGLKVIVANLLKYYKFKKSISKLNLTKKLNEKNIYKITKQFEIVVTGSDEIWNVKNVAFASNFWYFFGEKIYSKTIVSMSASFGSAELSDLNQIRVSSLLNRYSFISVRDRHSKSIAEQLTGKDIHITLDPTLLYDPYNDFTIKRVVSKSYILLYINSTTSNEKEILIQFAKKNNLIIISLAYPVFWANKNHIGLGIDQWLSYFRYAEYIVTNTLHGLIFAIKNKKPTWILNNALKSNKINGLIDLLEIHLPNKVYNLSSLSRFFNTTQREFEKTDTLIKMIQSQNKTIFNDLFKA
jgi:polysaccharide pyruvyl transferase WcaK-like protein